MNIVSFVRWNLIIFAKVKNLYEMQLFYAPDMTPPDHTLGEEESKHCVRVLRLGCGDRLHLTDGRGNLYLCRITDDNPKRCRVCVEETSTEYDRLPYRLTMAVAPTKNNDRFEWFLEKATEIGIAEIVPLDTARSERRVFKTDRGDKVITAAMKQSLKAYRPQLHEMTPFAQAVAEADGQKFIAHCGEPLTPEGKPHLGRLLRPGGRATVFIGPEGDFSPEEVALALRHGFREVSLGTQRLRTETAAVVATVIAASANENGGEAGEACAGTSEDNATDRTARS